MADKRSNIVLRFGIVYLFILIAFGLVIYRIVVLQFIERDQWLEVAAKNKKTDILVKPNRGNIFASDGRLMASSIPTYYIYMDTRVPALHEKGGALFKEKIDSLSQALSAFFGDKSKSAYKSMIQKAYREGKGELQLHPKRISYSQLKDLRSLPLFNLGRNKSGLITKELVRREKPFGSLASRTIGDIYADEAKGGKNGLELYFNEELLGTPGVSVRQKVANRWEETVQVEPVDGMDLLTTIDINLQDIAESTLVDSLKSFDASSGYAIIMEVKTGEVKAIVNMQQNKDGSYSENRNGAVADQVEPGSTFKIASLMALLDEGKARITDTIHTGNGIHRYHTSDMRDHNYHRGGYGNLSLAEVIHASSNVGISLAVTKAWGDNPSGFVDKLYEMGLNEPMNIEIPGTASPKIRHPKDKSTYWSKTTLPWMSIGYETQIPPIYTLAFFNAIANDGRMIKPYLVKAILKNGQTIKTFETELINSQICRPSTLKTVQETLLGVIEGKKGTAQNMRSKHVRIAGKTGTAQISKGTLGYKAGGKSHQVSFCGYFPADNPLFSCIVVIREPKNGYPSGGRMAGSVFKDIAERTMALKSNLKPEQIICDTTIHLAFAPKCKNGNYGALHTVMSKLNLNYTGNKAEWIKTKSQNNSIGISQMSINKKTIPDLTGLGAKDAVFLLGEMGIVAQIMGRGKVVSQNLKPGASFHKGQTIMIQLEN
ncbi:MAG: transpeptidase family protein [Paludibacteraceae bacterium]|nr:transpeptidase family protein [Paludibacteraceae bacterium]